MPADGSRAARRAADPTAHHHQAIRLRACQRLVFDLPDLDRDVLAWLAQDTGKTEAQLVAAILEQGLRRAWADAMLRADRDDEVRFDKPTRVTPLRDAAFDSYEAGRRNGTPI